jgi:PAS domain S-box-containing protein
MLAASLEAMREQVARLYEARLAGAGLSGACEPDPGDIVELLDHLCAALRRGDVEPPRTHDPEIAVRELGLLSACIHDVIEQHGLDVSAREMRVLSDWLLAAATRHAIHERTKAEARLSLLSKVGALAGTLQYEEVLSAAARLSIPEMADWCIVDVFENEDARRVEVAHRFSADAALAEELRRLIHHTAPPRLPGAKALQAGRSIYIPDYSERTPREQIDGELSELARRLGVCSVIIIPIPVSSSLAAMAFLMTSESGRRYGLDDLALAEELARRAGQVIENALLHQQLRETETRFRVAIAHSNITVFEVDREGRHRWMFNPQLGYPESDVLGKSHTELSPPEEVAQLKALTQPALETGERVRGEVQLTGRDGGVVHMLVALEPLRDASGAITGIAGASTDITDQKRAQEELAQALAFREQVMGILGHDLRSPLSAVRVLVTLLQRRADLSEPVRESLEEIDRAGKRMLEMIGTLLDFTESRFMGSLPTVPVPTDMHEVCRSVVEELLAMEAGRTIDLDLEGDGRGTWDPARMAQVVSNLVGNALKHGGRHGPVRVSVGGDEDEVVLRVENRGPAIAPELIPTLFEPFRRGSGSRDSSHARGLGLGLYIVRQIVNAHGGAISVRSTAEDGTAFTVRLPRGSGRADEAQRIGPDGGAAASAP